MRYDTTLKELFQTPPLRLLSLLAQAPVVELLTVEYPAVKMRRPDLVYRLPDGAIHQLELQSENDEAMDWRMLDYYPPLYRQFEREPIQYVLYVGKAPLKMKGVIKHKRLRFSYLVIDIREFEAALLLASESVADNLLALLCHNGDNRATVQKILRRFARLPEKECLDRIAQLLILSDLRKLQVTVKEEVKRMPLTFNLLENEVFRDVFLEGEEKGQKRLLQRQLEHRFGKLPKWARTQLASANAATLETWGLKLLEAKRLEEVLLRPGNGRPDKKH
jgi:hypothetical protein